MTRTTEEELRRGRAQPVKPRKGGGTKVSQAAVCRQPPRTARRPVTVALAEAPARPEPAQSSLVAVALAVSLAQPEPALQKAQGQW